MTHTHANGSTLRGCALAAGLFALGGCSGFGSLGLPGASTESAPAPAPSAASSSQMAGRWLLASPGRGQCYMTFGASAAAPGGMEGTIAPEGGCPGRFFTSRKWTFEQGSLVMRDHNGKVLAQLAESGGAFSGKATTGEPVTLMH